MSKFKKLSLLLIFVCSLFCGVFSFTPKKLSAENETAILTIEKITYDKNITDSTDNLIGKIGDLTNYNTLSQEGLQKLKQAVDFLENDALKNRPISDSIKPTKIEYYTEKDCVISVNRNSDSVYEAVVVKLSPALDATIQVLNPNLTINGVNVNLLPLSINGLDSYMFIGAYDFSPVNSILENFNYPHGGYFNFEFTYNNQTPQTNSFSFYMVDEQQFFSDVNFPILKNTTKEDVINDEKNINFFYSNSSKEKPTLSFNPYKFAPVINFNYNETQITLNTTLENNKVKLTSSNTNYFKDQTLDINPIYSKVTTSPTFEENKYYLATGSNYTLILDEATFESTTDIYEITNYYAELVLDALGKYVISYDLMFTNSIDNTYTRLYNDQTDSLTELKTYTLYNIGYEVQYKDYSNTTLPNEAQYKKFYNDIFSNDYTYKFSSLTPSKLTIESLLNATDETKIDVNTISSTNQAPIKLISYVSENLTGAKFYKIIKNTTTGNYELTDETSYSLSYRFEESGFYAIILPYKFETYKTDTLYQVVLFKIENSKPKLNFYNLIDGKTDINLSNLEPINKNNFTSKTTYAVWNDEQSSPFSIPTKIQITLNNTILDISNKIINKNGFNYVELAENGEYNVQITYGVYSNSIEKSFVKDDTEIEFNVYAINKNENTYSISSQLNLEDNKTTTNSNFAIFTKDKIVKSNKISIKYDYIALNKVNNIITPKFLNGKIYVYNNYELTSLYDNLTYSNNKINNLLTFDELNNYKFESNSNAVISINALYHFIITDNAGNSKEFYILLDSTSPIVLETNDIINLDKVESETEDEYLNRVKTEVESKTYSIKEDDKNQTTETIISSSYSLLFGNFKTLNFKVTAGNLDFARKFFNDETILVNTNKILPILIDSKNISVSALNNITKKYDCKKIDTLYEDFNILSVNTDLLEGEEVEYIYTINSVVHGINNCYSFTLNTDKSKIFVYNNETASIGGENIRISRNSVTNAKTVYINYVDNNTDLSYRLKSLTLSYYAIDKISSNSFEFVSTPVNFDLLSLRKPFNDGYISNLINPTYYNGTYYTKEGKYVITKTYNNNEEATQTFYVNRTSPLNYFNEDTEIFNLDNTTIKKSHILYYENNNQNLITNRLDISSLLNTLTIKYDSIVNLDFYYVILDSENNVLFNSKEQGNNYTFKNKGIYSIVIFDNSNNDYNKANKLIFRINLISDTPSGNFIINNDRELSNNQQSTKTNNLKFVFSDDISEFMYNININNIILKQGQTEILRTTAENTGKSFTFRDGTSVYYKTGSLDYDGLFSLTKEELPGTKLFGEKRYKYTLTILDDSKSNSILFENGISKETFYNLELTYNTSKTLILDGTQYNNSIYTIEIDHTAPKENAKLFLQNDKFLTEEEKNILLNSIVYKDKSSSINFENYAFIIKDVPLNFGANDTNRIYFRKYNKYTDTTSAGGQSLVLGDNDYYDTTITRNRFDANALDETGKMIYTDTSYYNETNNTLSTFLKPKNLSELPGYYEIIEIDEAENYTIYTVVYSENYNISIDYSYINNGVITKNNQSGTNIVDGNGFSLSKISTNAYDYLNITLTIQQKNKTTVENLRYFPIKIESEQYTYFNNLDNLIQYINNKISNVSDHIGTNILITNRDGMTVSIQNNIPTEEINYESYIIDYSDRFVVTIPDAINNTTVTEFNVYPVLNGEKSNDKLRLDSNGTEINIENNKIFMFNKSNTDYPTETISIYYLEWIDNFGRIYNKVKVIGAEDYKYFDFSTAIGKILERNGETYTIDNSNVVLNYQPELYSIKVYYMVLPNNNRILLNIPEDLKQDTKLNLFEILSNGTDNYINSNIKFIVELTDLTTLINADRTTYTLSYIYYSQMPNLDFTDSASNSLDISANRDDYIVSTSKNVALSYINNTLFNVTVTATREYVDNYNQKQTETITNINKEYVFSNLGDYEITVVNELGKTNKYKFNITTATNKTYQILTNESNMNNFEVISSGDTVEINSCVFDVYYSIYNTTLKTNSDFNLESENLLTKTEFTNEYDFDKLWVINKVTSTTPATVTPYKYVAVKKIPYNSNFLNIGYIDNLLLKINYLGLGETTNLAENLNGYSITFTQGVNITLPLYNTEIAEGGNRINIKLYYNNQLVNLNNNIYSIDLTNKIQTLNLSKVPAGIYNLYIEDNAGNTQSFAGNTFLNIVMLNEMAITLNNVSPIDYAYYNSTVNLKILEQRQYNTNSISIKVLKNGETYKGFTRDSNGEYVFTDYGFYTVELNATASNNTEISKIIHFTIFNENIAYKEFSFISLNGQNIQKVLKNNVDVTNDLKKFYDVGNKSGINSDYYKNAYLYNLNLASTMKYYYYETNADGEFVLDEEGNRIQKFDTYNGNGLYEIFIDTQNSILEKQTYSFKVWIRDENVSLKLNSNVKEGTSSVNAIEFSYNAYLIYSQIGECSIYINDQLVANINASSANAVSKFTINRDQKGTFIVQIKSDNNTELSYVVYKKEPLSTTSIIVIVISSIVVAGAIFMFIKLRRKIKIK